MQSKKRKQNSGFIALMSAVVISAIIMGYILTTNRTSFGARFDALDLENKHIASDLAESCVNQALLQLAENYQYDPTNAIFIVGSGTCTIVSTTPHATRTGSSTLVTVSTRGAYKNTFSDFQTQVTVSNPSITSFTPPPSCYLWTNTNSIASGQSVTLGWNSSNTTSMKILAINNHTYDLGNVSASGSQSVTPSASETFVGTATNSAGTAQCTTPAGFIAPSIIVQPPATCADTVMMFDRTGSMTSGDLSNERNAGTTLLGLYQNATPPGQVGIGSFGSYPNQAIPAGAASIPTGGILSQNWATLTGVLNSITGSNSSVGSNLAQAVIVGSAPLIASSNIHKALIFVTDGEPNEPSGSTPYDTGFNSPSANIQNANGDAWINPTNAYSNGNGDSSDTVNTGNRHRFYNFNIPTIPTGSTVAGIEATADAWATTTNIVQTPVSPAPQRNPSTTLAPNQWLNPTRAYVGDNSYTTDSTSGHQQGYGSFGFTIPSNAVITGIAVAVDAKSSDSSGCDVGAELSSNNGSTFTSSGTQTGSISNFESTYSLGGSSSLWGRSWLPSDFADGKFAVRLQNIHTGSCTGGATLSVDQLTATVSYTTPVTAPVACQLGMDLSWNTGASWTTEKTQTLTGTETTYTLGSSSDDWSSSHTWTLSEFTNANFRARVHAVDSGTNCDNASVVHLDWLQIKVHYTQPADPTSALLTAATNAKASGVEVFTVRYSTDTNATAIALLKQIASGPADYFQSPTTQAGISSIFNTIGTQACPAALAPPTPPTPPIPPPPPPPPPNITVGSWIETAP